jgi:hypothetical protein
MNHSSFVLQGLLFDQRKVKRKNGRSLAAFAWDEVVDYI